MSLAQGAPSSCVVHEACHKAHVHEHHCVCAGMERAACRSSVAKSMQDIMVVPVKACTTLNANPDEGIQTLHENSKALRGPAHLEQSYWTEQSCVVLGSTPSVRVLSRASASGTHSGC